MKKIQDVSAFIFIICVFVLSAVAILGVWDMLSNDVIEKSASTIGLLAVVAAIVISAGRFFDHDKVSATTDQVIISSATAGEVNPAFTVIRHNGVMLLITSVSVLALLGVLAIWEVLQGEVLEKSISSIAIASFAFFIIIVTCLQREQYKFMEKKMSGWVLVPIIFFGWLFLQFLFMW